MSNKNITAKSMKMLRYERQVSGGWDGTSDFWNKETTMKAKQNNMKILETFTKSQPRNKRNMLYFVRDIVKMYRLSNDMRLPEISNGEFSTHDIANYFCKINTVF